MWRSFVAVLNQRRVRLSLVILTVGGEVALIIHQLANGSRADAEAVGRYQSNVILLALVSFWAIYPFLRLRTSGDETVWVLDAQQKDLVKRFKTARKNYRKIKGGNDSRLRHARAELQNLSDPKGKRIISAGGVTVYERWIDTPTASFPITGVEASHVYGQAGTIGIITPVVENNTLARVGPNAKNMVKAINRSAFFAPRNEPHRQQRLANLPAEIAALENNPLVPSAEHGLSEAQSSLPPNLHQSLIRQEKRILRTFYTGSLLVGLFMLSTSPWIVGDKGLVKQTASTTSPTTISSTAPESASSDSSQPATDGGLTTKPPAVAFEEARFQCGLKLIDFLDAYRIKDLSPTNIGKVWFEHSDYKLRNMPTPVEISQPLIKACADAAQEKMAVVGSAVKISCNWPRAALAKDYGLAATATRKTIARAVSKDFVPSLQSLVAALCAQYIR